MDLSIDYVASVFPQYFSRTNRSTPYVIGTSQINIIVITYVLKQNINMSDLSSLLNPRQHIQYNIGLRSGSSQFRNTQKIIFDGNNKTITYDTQNSEKGIFNAVGNITIKNLNIVVQNEYVISGGGIVNFWNENVKIINCHVVGNIDNGGGIVGSFADEQNNRLIEHYLHIENCSFTGNNEKGGGIIYSLSNMISSSKITIESCLINTNTLNEGGGIIYFITKAIYEYVTVNIHDCFVNCKYANNCGCIINRVKLNGDIHNFPTYNILIKGSYCCIAENNNSCFVILSIDVGLTDLSVNIAKQLILLTEHSFFLYSDNTPINSFDAKYLNINSDARNKITSGNEYFLKGQYVLSGMPKDIKKIYTVPSFTGIDNLPRLTHFINNPSFNLYKYLTWNNKYNYVRTKIKTDLLYISGSDIVDIYSLASGCNFYISNTDEEIIKRRREFLDQIYEDEQINTFFAYISLVGLEFLSNVENYTYNQPICLIHSKFNPLINTNILKDNIGIYLDITDTTVFTINNNIAINKIDDLTYNFVINDLPEIVNIDTIKNIDFLRFYVLKNCIYINNHKLYSYGQQYSCVDTVNIELKGDSNFYISSLPKYGNLYLDNILLTENNLSIVGPNVTNEIVGIIQYTLNIVENSEMDSFNFFVSDGNSASNVSTIKIQCSPFNIGKMYSNTKTNIIINKILSDNVGNLYIMGNFKIKLQTIDKEKNYFIYNIAIYNISLNKWKRFGTYYPSNTVNDAYINIDTKDITICGDFDKLIQYENSKTYTESDLSYIYKYNIETGTLSDLKWNALNIKKTKFDRIKYNSISNSIYIMYRENNIPSLIVYNIVNKTVGKIDISNIITDYGTYILDKYVINQNIIEFDTFNNMYIVGTYVNGINYFICAKYSEINGWSNFGKDINNKYVYSEMEGVNIFYSQEYNCVYTIATKNGYVGATYRFDNNSVIPKFQKVGQNSTKVILMPDYGYKLQNYGLIFIGANNQNILMSYKIGENISYNILSNASNGFISKKISLLTPVSTSNQYVFYDSKLYFMNANMTSMTYIETDNIRSIQNGMATNGNREIRTEPYWLNELINAEANSLNLYEYLIYVINYVDFITVDIEMFKKTLIDNYDKFIQTVTDYKNNCISVKMDGTDINKFITNVSDKFKWSIYSRIYKIAFILPNINSIEPMIVENLGTYFLPFCVDTPYNTFNYKTRADSNLNSLLIRATSMTYKNIDYTVDQTIYFDVETNDNIMIYGIVNGSTLCRITPAKNIDISHSMIFATNGIINSLTSDSIGNIYVGGSFTKCGDIYSDDDFLYRNIRNIAKYTVNGIWEDLNGYYTWGDEGIVDYNDGTVNNVIVDSYDNIIITGFFNRITLDHETKENDIENSETIGKYISATGTWIGLNFNIDDFMDQYPYKLYKNIHYDIANDLLFVQLKYYQSDYLISIDCSLIDQFDGWKTCDKVVSSGQHSLQEDQYNIIINTMCVDGTNGDIYLIGYKIINIDANLNYQYTNEETLNETYDVETGAQKNVLCIVRYSNNVLTTVIDLDDYAIGVQPLSSYLSIYLKDEIINKKIFIGSDNGFSIYDIINDSLKNITPSTDTIFYFSIYYEPKLNLIYAGGINTLFRIYMDDELNILLIDEAQQIDYFGQSIDLTEETIIKCIYYTGEQLYIGGVIKSTYKSYISNLAYFHLDTDEFGSLAYDRLPFIQLQRDVKVIDKKSINYKPKTIDTDAYVKKALIDTLSKNKNELYDYMSMNKINLNNNTIVDKNIIASYIDNSVNFNLNNTLKSKSTITFCLPDIVKTDMNIVNNVNINIGEIQHISTVMDDRKSNIIEFNVPNTNEKITFEMIVLGNSLYLKNEKKLYGLNDVITVKKQKSVVRGLKPSKDLKIRLLSKGSLIIHSSVPDELPCFVKGTNILMKDGDYKLVENINKNDIIMGENKIHHKVKGIYSYISKTHPYIISKNSISDNYPEKEFLISGEHLIKYNGSWILPKNNINFHQYTKNDETEYYHIELDNYITDNCIIEGNTIVESFTGYYPLLTFVEERNKRISSDISKHEKYNKMSKIIEHHKFLFK